MNKAHYLGFVICLLTCVVSGQAQGPPGKDQGSPKTYGLNYESVTFTSKDGTKLHGWFVPAVTKSTGTVINLHGVGEHLNTHFPRVAWLPKQGFNVFVFDYRGFGKSTGLPNRRDLCQDSVAAIEYVMSRKDVDPEKILVFGQSLGGANAIVALAENSFPNGKIRGVVIEAAFHSYESIARQKVASANVPRSIGKAFVKAVFDDSFSPGPVVHKIAPVPILFVHGTADKVVPYKHSELLFKKAKEPKQLWTVKGARHMEPFLKYGSTYRPKLVKFFKKCLAGKVATGKADTNVPAKELLAYWSFDKVSASGKVADDSGNGRDAQIFKGELVKGRVGAGLKLNGKRGSYVLTKLVSHELKGDFSISAWHKSDGLTRDGGIISACSREKPPGLCLQLKRDRLGVYAGKYISGVKLEKGQWYNVVVVYRDAEKIITIYVNGKEALAGKQSVRMPESSAMVIGRFYMDVRGYLYSGIVDEVKVYGRALTAEAIRKNYQITAALPAAKVDGKLLKVDIDEDTLFMEEKKKLPYYWVKVKDKAAWSPRDSSGELVHDGKMWLLGGWYNSSTKGLRDVWSSDDGSKWTKILATAPWKHADLPVSLAFKNRMWFMGGWYAGRLPDASASNEVWSSANGAQWDCVTKKAGWSARCGAAGVVFKNKMWILGGIERYLDGNASHLKNDVWSSSDGKTWTQVTAKAPWAPRAFHGAVVFQGKIWVFGGGNYQPSYQGFNDVWSSPDGVNWTKVTEHAAWDPRIWFSSVVFKEHMWVLGGWNPTWSNWKDAWYSADGVKWHKLPVIWPTSMWSARHEQSAYIFKDKLWIVGGNAYPLVNDVWYLELTDDWLKPIRKMGIPNSVRSFGSIESAQVQVRGICSACAGPRR